LCYTRENFWLSNSWSSVRLFFSLVVKLKKQNRRRNAQFSICWLSFHIKLFAFWILPIAIKFELGFQKSVTLFWANFYSRTSTLLGSLPDLIWTKTEINFAWCGSPAGQWT